MEERSGALRGREPPVKRALKRIVVYNDLNARTSISGLFPFLEKSFPHLPVETADTASFLDCLKDHDIMAVIPGIYGEECRYYDLFGGDRGMKAIEDFVQKGGLLMTLCAGSYLVANKTEYMPPWGPSKERVNASPLFNAVAIGPLAGLAQKPEKDLWYSDCSVVSVSYKKPDGRWEKTGIAYGNGPALIPHTQPPDFETLACYDEIPGRPVAAAWQTRGQGAVMWLGVLPYIQYQPAERTSKIEALRQLMENLMPHETGRHEFWNSLVGRIEKHLSGTGPSTGGTRKKLVQDMGLC